MAILRTLNEFTRESVVMALEPSRTCIASCSYCFARLNHINQYANRSKSLKDDSSFERTLEKAYSSSYDPTNFSQWALRERLVLGMSNTVEPFQDYQQAILLLKTLDKFDIPIFVQTKTVNLIEVLSHLKLFEDNSSIFVSIPSLDQRVAKRFEPGTPPIADRLKGIEMLADLGFWVIAALSPYHEDLCDDPAKLIQTLADSGVNEIFFDRLHLTQSQYKVAPDRLMAEMAGGRGKEWPPRAIEHLRIIYEESIAHDLHFFCNGFVGDCYGFHNTVSTISPDNCFTRGTPWPYHDGGIFQTLVQTFYSEESGITPLSRDFDTESIVVYWSDVLQMMESEFSIDQEFSYSSLMDIVPLYKRIPLVWKKAIGIRSTKDCALMSEWFRCLWNNPYKHQFFWRHPWTRIACNMDGVPFLDDAGNFVGIFDPDYEHVYNRYFRKVESLDSFRTLNWEEEEESIEISQ